MNQTITYSNTRKNLKSVFDKACDTNEAILVDRRNGENIVIVSESQFSSLEETAYLLSSPKNAQHLAQSLNELESGETIEFDLAI